MGWREITLDLGANPTGKILFVVSSKTTNPLAGWCREKVGRTHGEWGREV